MKTVIAMRAIPGSGKSSLAKQLVNSALSEGKSALICSADDYFVELGGGKYQFNPSKIGDAHKYCFRKFIKAVNEGVDLIVVDNTNLSAYELSPYKAFAEAYDYDFSINEVVADPAAAFRRQSHGVPEVSHKRMNDSFNKEFIPPWWPKKRMLSKTTETGEPLFEEEVEAMEDKKASRTDRLSKVADHISKKYGV